MTHVMIPEFDVQSPPELAAMQQQMTALQNQVLQVQNLVIQVIDMLEETEPEPEFPAMPQPLRGVRG